MSTILKVSEQVTGTINPVDQFGNPAPVENIAWSVSDPSIADTLPSSDGKSCAFAGKGKIGTVQAVCTADAKIGEGDKEITERGDLEFVADEAVGLGITFGAPEASGPHPSPPIA